MPVLIEDDLLEATGLTTQDARETLAAALYAQGRVSLGVAARLAGTNRVEFQKVLGRQRISVGPTMAELDREVATLKGLGML